jgi:hypothetical protein
MGRLEEAEVHFKKALELDPDLPPTMKGWAWYIWRRDGARML